MALNKRCVILSPDLTDMLNRDKNPNGAVGAYTYNISIWRSVPTSTLRRVLALMVLCAMVLCAFGRDGNQSYSFLNITSSSKIYGLGGMNISLVDDDIMTTDQNPALLGQEMSGQLALNYMRYIGDSNFAGLRYGQRWELTALGALRYSTTAMAL